MAEWKGIVSEIPNDKWKRIVGEYVTFEKRMDHWTCKSCLSPCTGRRYKLIGHLCREPGNEIKICKKITLEEVEELKGKLGLQHVLTGAHGQQQQQPGENDEIRQENGNKKRKGASGSGTGGSNQREAEISFEATSMQSGCPQQHSSFSQLRPAWGEDLAATAETNHDRGRSYVPNIDNGGFQGTNAVGSSGLPNIIPQGQFSSSQGQVDHRNDQHIHPHTSTHRNAFGDKMAGEIVLADEPQPPCPPRFNSDSWKFYITIDSVIDPWLGPGKFLLYKGCISQTNEEERKACLGFLESLCSELKNERTSAPDELRCNLYTMFLNKVLFRGLEHLTKKVDSVEGIEQKVRGETEEGIDMVVRRRNSDKACWLGYAAWFKSDVDKLEVAARKVRSLEDVRQLLSYADNLSKRGDKVIEAGWNLLNPVPYEIWNPTYMSCGSQFVNRYQMPPTQFPPQV